MTNWEVTICDIKGNKSQCVVESWDIEAAFKAAELMYPGNNAISARFHSTFLSNEFGYGFGPIGEFA